MSERDYFIEFSKQLGELTASINGVLARLEKGDAKMAEHEARLSNLERRERRASESESAVHMDLKEWIIRQLVKMLGWGMVIIGSLAGADSLVAKLVK